MNIFLLDENPIVAAQSLCDKHVVKMILESAQMLSTAHRLLDGDTGNEHLYKATHKNHPCSVWVRESVGNYNWLWDHFKALCMEYTYRYGKIHKSERLADDLMTPPTNTPRGGLTPFALGMKTTNPECMDASNPVESYRKFYQTKQDKFKMVWTKRDVPYWFTLKNEIV